MDTYRWTRAEVDLDALTHNILQFRSALDPSIRIMAVVKANGYGHGAVKVAKEALAAGVDYLAVAFLDEALELRHNGIDAPILALGYTPPQGVETALEHNITISVFDEEVLEAASRVGSTAPNNTQPLRIHIKVDTGMGRLGLTNINEAKRFIQKAILLPGIDVEGIYTHYATADESDKTYIKEQYAKFDAIVNYFREQGVEFNYVHAGNSATGIDTPELTYNMVRLGVAMYGMYPSDEVNHKRVQLQPVMSLKTGIVMVKELPSGSGISYGAKYVTQEPETIATLPIGYADGYSRQLSGKAEVLIRGRRTPIIGNICMDQCMVRIDAPPAEVGDEVVLFGKQGDNVILADELARMLSTINYEITCMVSHRVPRVYLKNGQIVEFYNPLLNFTK